MSETANLPTLQFRERGRLRFVHVETNHRVAAEAGSLVLTCGPGGEHMAPGPFARLGERRRMTDTAVSDRIF